MLTRELWSYYQGYVIIKVKGEQLEEFLNRAAAQGVCLWDVERLSGELLTARVSCADFMRLRDAVRGVPVTVSIRHKVGLPFLRQKLLQRFALLAGALLSLACIYLLSSVVWFVHVEGVDKVDYNLISTALHEAGVSPGVWRRSIEPREVEKHLLLRIPQLAWVGVSLRGTLVEVTLVEKTEISPDEKAPGDIVAGRSALVTQIIPFTGTALVQEGETVAEGQVLISGALDGYSSPGKAGSGRYLRAAGIVRGRVWYRGFGEASLVSRVPRRTGQACTGYSIRVGPWSWQWGQTVPPFLQYEEEVTIQGLTLPPFGWVLPVQLETIEFHEVVIETIERDLETAKEAALRRSWEAVEARMTPGAEILSQEVDVTVEEHESGVLVRARRTVEVHEEIGVFRPVSFAKPEEIGEGSQ
ncbi:MAG TPA: sporulation protein YqfD [Firmicutes bacterium]|nr:sporulation protein YqfD [Bacillota bacterium]